MSQDRKRGRPQAVTPEEILERAVVLFCAEGIDSLSLNEVCKRLGISKPALYRSFGSEDGLRRAALGHYFTVWLGPRFGLMDYTQPFAAQCEQLVELVCHDDPKSPSSEGCLFMKMRLSKPILGAESLGTVEELEHGMKAQLTAWMGGIAESGQLKKDLAPADAAAYIDAQIMLAAIYLSQGTHSDEVAARLSLALSALR